MNSTTSSIVNKWLRMPLKGNTVVKEPVTEEEEPACLLDLFNDSTSINWLRKPLVHGAVLKHATGNVSRMYTS